MSPETCSVCSAQYTSGLFLLQHIPNCCTGYDDDDVVHTVNWLENVMDGKCSYVIICREGDNSFDSSVLHIDVDIELKYSMSSRI